MQILAYKHEVLEKVVVCIAWLKINENKQDTRVHADNAKEFLEMANKLKRKRINLTTCSVYMSTARIPMVWRNVQYKA